MGSYVGSIIAFGIVGQLLGQFIHKEFWFLKAICFVRLGGYMLQDPHYSSLSLTSGVTSGSTRADIHADLTSWIGDLVAQHMQSA